MIGHHICSKRELNSVVAGTNYGFDTGLKRKDEKNKCASE